MSPDPSRLADAIRALTLGLALPAVAQSETPNGANPPPPAAVEPAPAPEIAWHHGDLTRSLDAAAAANKQVLVYFWMEGSEHCNNLWKNTLTTPGAAAELARFVCHGADATTADGAALVQRFGIKTLPTLLVVGANGTVDDAMIGFVPLADFVSEMQRIRAGSGTVQSLRRAAEAAPDDLDLRFSLGIKLRFVGDEKGSQAIYDSIRRDDPEGTTAPGAELLLFEVRQDILARAPDKNDPATWDLAPMYRRLRKTRQPVVLWKGWNWLAQVEGSRGDASRQIAAWRAARPHAPDAQFDEWAAEALQQLWERRDALQSKERALARDLGKNLIARQKRQAGDEPAPGAAARSPEVRAFVLSAAACGLSIAGKRGQALACIEQAKKLAPDDGKIDRLEQQIRKR